MVDSIGPFRPDLPPLGPERAGDSPGAGTGAAAPKGADFKEILKKSIQEVNQLQMEADQAIQELAAGRRDDYAGVITAVEKADVAFRALMQVRNKLIDAYQEFNRMRV